LEVVTVLADEILREAITLPEAVDLSARLGHALDRRNLERYARGGRLIARKSRGTWLTTRSAMVDLITDLERERRGRPLQRARSAAIPAYQRTAQIETILNEVDQLRTELARRPLPSPAFLQALETDAIYHTAHLEGNPLTLEEARRVIDAYRDERAAGSHDASQVP
jgi:hypothetical protein